MSESTGTVKWFDKQKGYGFIAGEDGRDVYVHYSQIRSEGFRTLSEGQVVSYQLTETPKGPAAHEVTVLS